CFFFFFSSRRRHTRWPRDWSSDVCSSDLQMALELGEPVARELRGRYEFHVAVQRLSRDLTRQQSELETALNFLSGKRRLEPGDRSEDTRLNSSHVANSYAVFCLKKKKQNK